MDANSIDLLRRLQTWYSTHCNGVWEHTRGITIESCDNPGWWIKIDLVGTSSEWKSFPNVSKGVGQDNHPTLQRWIRCYVEDGIWHGAGDETQLPHLLENFLDWAEESAS